MDPYVVDGLVDWLIENEKMSRPPVKAAKILAFIVQLHKKKQPFPTRAEASEHLGISVATIDAALSTRIAEGYLTLDIRTLEGSVARRASTVKERYYIPHVSLVDAYDHLTQRGKKRSK